MHRVVAAALALCLSACVHLKPPEQGGPAWFRATSPHFELQTDLPERDVQAKLEELETRRAALLTAAWENWPSPEGRTALVVLRNLDEFSDFAPSGMGQYHLTAFPSNGPLDSLLVLPDSGARKPMVDVLQYELTVGLALALLPRAPSWLMSGLGRYLETLELDENRHVAVIGSASREMLKGAGNPRPGLIINGWSTSPVAFYTRNWERVHFLMTEHGVELNEWFNRLHRGENPDASFQAVFHTTLAALDLPVREYSRTILHSGQVRVATIAAPRWKGLTTVEPMAPAEVHALFARLHKYGPFDSQSERDRALPEIEAALRLDPMELSALLMGPLEALPVSDRLARLRELAKVHPEDYRVPLMEATWSAADAPDRESNLRKAMALDPDARGPILLLAELLAGPAPQEAAALADRLALRGGVPPGLRLALLVSLTAAKSCALAGVQREALTDWYRDADGAAVFPPEVAGKLEQLTACADQANAPAGHAP